MPDYWQMPTVSMGLGPIQAIYQAQFWKYLENRRPDAEDRPQGLVLPRRRRSATSPNRSARSRWPGAKSLDNLIFVINCNLQRLDGPVRGNGKIIQELEGVFRGAGWNAIKVVWGSYWDPLLARDKDGILRKLMMETVDGEYQAYKAFGGAYTREHFFGKYAGDAADGGEFVRRRHLAPEPRRPRSAQGLRGLPRGGEHPGHADRDPGQDGQGLRHGRRPASRRTRAPGEEDERRRGARIPRPLPASRFPTTSSATCRTTTRARIRRKCSTCSNAAARSAASCRSAAAKIHVKCRRRSWSEFEQITKGSGEREISIDHGAGARHEPVAARQGDRPARRADRRRRGPHLRHGRHVPRRSASMRRAGRSIARRTPTSSCTTAKARDGQVLQEGISEAGGMSAWIAAAHQLFAVATSRCCRSSFTIRSSASAASAT